jgi:hypothetical protein
MKGRLRAPRCGGSWAAGTCSTTAWSQGLAPSSSPAQGTSRLGVQAGREGRGCWPGACCCQPHLAPGAALCASGSSRGHTTRGGTVQREGQESMGWKLTGSWPWVARQISPGRSPSGTRHAPCTGWRTPAWPQQAAGSCWAAAAHACTARHSAPQRATAQCSTARTVSVVMLQVRPTSPSTKQLQGCFPPESALHLHRQPSPCLRMPRPGCCPRAPTIPEGPSHQRTRRCPSSCAPRPRVCMHAGCSCAESALHSMHSVAGPQAQHTHPHTPAICCFIGGAHVHGPAAGSEGQPLGLCSPPPGCRQGWAPPS